MILLSNINELKDYISNLEETKRFKELEKYINNNEKIKKLYDEIRAYNKGQGSDKDFGPYSIKRKKQIDKIQNTQQREKAYKIYNSKTTYKNGHYIDSVLSQEERDIIDRIAQEINKQLKSWDDVPEISEDHNKE